jgi:uncharacterized PurR-regulated membrane protein YhhQ (DUF165 family)
MPQQPRQYRYFEFVMVAFVVVLVCSNLVGPAKAAQIDLPLIGAVTFGAGALFFPISYVFGDILTEVYGYSRARRVIWSGSRRAVAAVMARWCGCRMPELAKPTGLRIAFGHGHRAGLVFASSAASSSTRAGQMKVATNRRYQGALVGSTIAGGGDRRCSIR